MQTIKNKRKFVLVYLLLISHKSIPILTGVESLFFNFRYKKMFLKVIIQLIHNFPTFHNYFLLFLRYLHPPFQLQKLFLEIIAQLIHNFLIHSFINFFTIIFYFLTLFISSVLNYTIAFLHVKIKSLVILTAHFNIIIS